MSTHELAEPADGQVGSPSMFDRVADRVRRHRRLTGVAAIAVAVAVAGVTAAGLVPRPGAADPVSAVVAAASCPGTDPGPSINAGRSGLTGRLIPGEPVVATVCLFHNPYRSASASPTVARSAVVRDAVAADLAAALDAGERIPKDAVFSCPADRGGTVLAIFGYSVGAAVTVRISLSGCRFASNGSVTAATTPPAQQQITGLVGTDPN